MKALAVLWDFNGLQASKQEGNGRQTWAAFSCCVGSQHVSRFFSPFQGMPATPRDMECDMAEAIRLLRFARQRAFNDALHVAQIEHPQPRGRVGELARLKLRHILDDTESNR